MSEQKEKKIARCRYAHLHIKGDYSCIWEGLRNPQPTDEAQCESCEKFKSKYIEYPITVNKIETEPVKFDSWEYKTGTLVAVRPCDEEYEGKTFLGFFLGDLPVCIWPSFNSETGVIHCNTLKNPAMFVPELGKIIWGAGSWWSEIKSEDDLKQITDEDIENTWYVKLARQLAENEKYK